VRGPFCSGELLASFEAVKSIAPYLCALSLTLAGCSGGGTEEVVPMAPKAAKTSSHFVSTTTPQVTGNTNQVPPPPPPAPTPVSPPVQEGKSKSSKNKKLGLFVGLGAIGAAALFFGLTGSDKKEEESKKEANDKLGTVEPAPATPKGPGTVRRNPPAAVADNSVKMQPPLPFGITEVDPVTGGSIRPDVAVEEAMTPTAISPTAPPSPVCAPGAPVGEPSKLLLQAGGPVCTHGGCSGGSGQP